jgi:hypothetical protein
VAELTPSSPDTFWSGVFGFFLLNDRRHPLVRVASGLRLKLVSSSPNDEKEESHVEG